VTAACGGTTTVIPFAAQAKGGSLAAAVQDYHRRAEGKACIDYAFHLIVSDPTERVLGEELPALVRRGYTSIKVYMTYDMLKLSDRELLLVLEVARRERAMMMVHAENTDGIAWLTERLVAAGRTAPKYRADSRPPALEREATHRAITFSELVDVPILIVHVSGAEALEQIRWAQGRGLNIYAETCPQYLLLSAESLGLEGYRGAMCDPHGLYPRKGTIAIGADADLVVWDDKRALTLENRMLHHAVDNTPYDGMRITGWPALTLSRGEVVWQDGEFRGRPGRGAWLACERPTTARPRPRPVF
jgi:dihydroorotase-like cyclic amidohydrolase